MARKKTGEKLIQYQIRIAPSVLRALEAEAARVGLAPSALIRSVLTQYVGGTPEPEAEAKDNA